VADDELSAELEAIGDHVALASGLPMTRDPQIVVEQDAPLMLRALEAVLRLASEWADGEVSGHSALTEDRDWVRAACGEKLREAIASALFGEETPDDQS
jgi:hypothetical protein